MRDGEKPLIEEVLVIEAFGVPDNEVFARAWCSFWGLAAVIVDLKNGCAACAIREAFVAGVSVVIAVQEEMRGDGEVERVERRVDELL